MKKPTLIAVSSLVAMTVPVPTASEKMTTSDMRKDIIRANVADIKEDVENDVPTLDPPNPEKPMDDPDLITVTLTPDGSGTQIADNNKNFQQNQEKNVTSQQSAATVQQPIQTVSSIQEVPINNAQKVQITKSEIITLRSDDLSFHKNSTNIKREAYPILEDVKDYIEKNDFLVSIIGYTDTSGVAAYNKRLSLRRAEKVKSKLLELGLSEERILDLVGRGESNPIRSNETEEGREGNRRVEFKFIKKGQV